MGTNGQSPAGHHPQLGCGGLARPHATSSIPFRGMVSGDKVQPEGQRGGSGPIFLARDGWVGAEEGGVWRRRGARKDVPCTKGWRRTCRRQGPKLFDFPQLWEGLGGTGVGRMWP